jgi:hypothetical protein
MFVSAFFDVTEGISADSIPPEAIFMFLYTSGVLAWLLYHMTRQPSGRFAEL